MDLIRNYQLKLQKKLQKLQKMRSSWFQCFGITGDVWFQVLIISSLYSFESLRTLHQNTTMIGISNFCPKITRLLFTLNKLKIIQYAILQLELENPPVFV